MNSITNHRKSDTDFSSAFDSRTQSICGTAVYDVLDLIDALDHELPPPVRHTAWWLAETLNRIARGPDCHGCNIDIYRSEYRDPVAANKFAVLSFLIDTMDDAERLTALQLLQGWTGGKS